MTDPDELWRLERQFWLGGVDFYERTLAPESLMVLPEPAGVLDRVATVASIRSASRWRDVALEDRRHVRAAADTAVLSYVARAHRGDPDASYVAQCSSTYVRHDGRWSLVLHHQSPAGQQG